MNHILFSICCLCLASQLAAAYHVNHLWYLYKQVYQKSYKNSIEDERHMAAFQLNSKEIDCFNSNDSEKLGWSKEVNHFADQTPSEITDPDGESCGPKLRSTNNTRSRELVNKLMRLKGLEDEFTIDWRSMTPQRVTSVKDQGRCSSYAYATAALLEGQIANYKNVSDSIDSLSEESILECSSKGCVCGDVESALQLILKQGGIPSKDSYSSKGRNGTKDDNKCQFKNETVAMKFDEIVVLDGLSDSLIRGLLARYGPIATSMIHTTNFAFYDDGILFDELCSSLDEPDHFVLIVGHGASNGRNYWIAKNSYGQQWGLGGYFKIATNKHCKFGSTVYLAVNNELLDNIQ